MNNEIPAWLQELVRPNILSLAPYSSARDEYQGHEATVFLDANECPYNSPLNRYPDPLQRTLKGEIAARRGVASDTVFLGNGSDEAIDVVLRVFCQPRIDNVVAIDPSYGMYSVCAEINEVEYRRVKLNERFDFTASDILDAADDSTKIVFLCSPNNPTGNTLSRSEITKLLAGFRGIVVLDEAYIDFADEESLRGDVVQYERLVVLNTFSKAWASAGVRLGLAYAHPAIISLFNKVKYPYNVNQLTQDYALELLKREEDVEKWRKLVLEERPRVMHAVGELPYCERVFPTQANFFLARLTEATRVYDYLVSCGIVVRNRSSVALCNDCLRFTIGRPQENTALISALRNYQP